MKTRLRTSVVCLHQDKILAFHAIDPTSGTEYFFLPGGGLEEGEKAEEAAARETLEETGYIVRIDSSSRIISEYKFHWDGHDYACTTHFFRGHLVSDIESPRQVNEPGYHKGAHWLPVEDLEANFGYNPEILSAIQSLC